MDTNFNGRALEPFCESNLFTCELCMAGMGHSWTAERSMGTIAQWGPSQICKINDIRVTNNMNLCNGEVNAEKMFKVFHVRSAAFQCRIHFMPSRFIWKYLFAKFVINIAFVMCEQTYYDVIALMVIARENKRKREGEEKRSTRRKSHS